MSAQSATGGAEPLPDLKVGQMVIDSFNLWTPDSWVPQERLARVVNPCVQNDPDYAGCVEIDYVPAAWIGRHFVSRNNLRLATDAEISAAALASGGQAND